ncbi:MAG: 2OG-Fe(II) oxygenase family protein [Pseudomonadota bacterium]
MSLATFDLAAFEAAQGPARAEMAAQVDQLCRETGFLVVTGHGVDPNVIDALWDAVRRFFAQDADAKQAVAAAHGAPYGYLGPDQEALARSKGVDTPPDLKESFSGRPQQSAPVGAGAAAIAFSTATTPWPDVPGFQAAWHAYFVALEDLAARIMVAFAEALGLPSDHFAPFHKDPISALRALHYPATGADAEDNQQRAGAHTDYGTLTVLLPQTGTPGLQIKQGDRWVDVIAPQDAFVINIGDLMERWTANRWVSTLHRVVARPNQPARMSLAFFLQPDWHAEIAPLDGSSAYGPIASGPYLMQKFHAAAGGRS